MMADMAGTQNQSRRRFTRKTQRERTVNIGDRKRKFFPTALALKQVRTLFDKL